jgi:hypothetical protein
MFLVLLKAFVEYGLMKVIWKKIELKLWGNVSFKYFFSLEIRLFYQKTVLKWKISWVTSSHLGQRERLQ